MTRPSVLSLLTSLEPLSHWLPAFAMIFMTNAIVACARRPLGVWRWPLALFVLCAPATLPSIGEYANKSWGALDTVATTMAIVSAARLPALDHLLKTQLRPRGQLFFWMTLPMARFWSADGERQAANRRRVPRLLVSAALKRLAWEPLAALTVFFPGEAVPWPLHSAFAMLYFVLNLTAAADALSAFCLLLGCDVDVLFDAPLLSKSPRDFWSVRWNKFINRFALKHVALPVGRRWGQRGVILSVFATSGLFHEYFAWGVSGSDARYGMMSVFFVIQGLAVWAGTRLSFRQLPHWLGTTLTFAWMMLTAPLFFAAIEPALIAFGYPPAWFPFAALPR